MPSMICFMTLLHVAKLNDLFAQMLCHVAYVAPLAIRLKEHTKND